MKGGISMDFLEKISWLTWEDFDPSACSENEKRFYVAAQAFLHQDEDTAEQILRSLRTEDLSEEMEEAIEALLFSLLVWQDRFSELGGLAIPSDEEEQRILSHYANPFTTYELLTPMTEAPMADAIVGLPCMTVMMNGFPVNLVIDTGAMLTTLSQSVAERCGIKTTSFSVRPKNAFNEEFAVDHGIIADFVVGNLRIRNKECMVLADALIQFDGIGSIDGTIGWEVIKRMKWSMDYLTRRIRIEESVKTETTKNLSCDFFPLVRIQTDTNEMLAGLDTGANQSMLGAVMKSRFKPTIKTLQRLAVAGAMRDTSMQQVDRFDLVIGGQPITLQGIHLREDDIPIRPHLFQLPCLIGSDIAEGRTLVIDYPNRSLTLQ
jgi:hypothetical protein